MSSRDVATLGSVGMSSRDIATLGSSRYVIQGRSYVRLK